MIDFRTRYTGCLCGLHGLESILQLSYHCRHYGFDDLGTFVCRLLAEGRDEEGDECVKGKGEKGPQGLSNVDDR